MTMQDSRTLPDGVIAAALTALTPALEPDGARTAAHCRRLLDSGCDGIGLLGTTGEAASFSVAQRLQVLHAVLEAGIPPHRLIVGTGAAALDDARVLTREAAAAGCGGCLVSPPFYFKGVADAGVIRFYDTLIEGLGGAAVPLYLYHFPQTTQVPITATVIETLLARHPGRIAGIKDSSAQKADMLALARRWPDLRVYSGTETLYLALREAGGAGCIAAGANITVARIKALDEEWRKAGASERAEALQAEIERLRRLFDGVPMIAAMKALLARDAGGAGWDRVMPPLIQPEPASLTAFLERWDREGCPLPWRS